MASTPTTKRTAATAAGAAFTPSPLKEGKELWTLTKRLESRGSEGKEALDSMHQHTLTYMRACFSHAKRRLMEDARPAAANPNSPARDSAFSPAIGGSSSSSSSSVDHCCVSPTAPPPRAPPNTAAAATSESGGGANNSRAAATKRQRRSVAEAAQVAHVRQKVALFESFKGASSSAPSPSPSPPAAARLVSTATTVTAAPAQGSGRKVSSLGSNSTNTIMVSSVASAGGSGSSSSSSSYHAVFPGLDLSLTSMGPRAALAATTATTTTQAPGCSSSQPPRASEEKIDAMVAPVEASMDGMEVALPAAAQQITAAMRELRIEEEQEGPEPIIECNHKQPGQGASGGAGGNHAEMHPIPATESSSQPHETGGGSASFFGMVQKTLGLGKHRASSTGAQQQAQHTVAPAVVASPPLSPLRPENTYQMSDSEQERHDDDFSSDDDDDDGLLQGGGGGGKRRKGRRAQKHIPAWARGPALAAALEAQFTADPQLWVDPDAIFPEPPTTCNLEEIFKVRKKRYYKRTSSGMWEQDGLTLSEKLAYKHDVSGGARAKKK